MNFNRKKAVSVIKKEFRLAPSYIIGIVWTALVVIILGWIICASLSTTREIFNDKILDSGLHFENYYRVLVRNKAIDNLINSVIYTFPSCLLVLLISAPGAYCLSRFKFKGNKIISGFLVLCLSIPAMMLIMPLFSFFSTLNLSGNKLTMILLYTGIGIPYTTFFLLTFYKSIPSSFEEAAIIDGCSIERCFWSIMFPLTQPAIVTITIFNFIKYWNEYFIPIIFANKPGMRPLSVGLYQMVYSMQNSGDWAGLFAAVVIVFVPTVIIYIFLSDKIIAGVTAGGIKG